MKVNEIAETVSAEMIYASANQNKQDIQYAVAADLMSEVMVDTVDGSLIITGLINPQVVRTAEMMNANAVIFIRGKEIPQNIIDLAKDRDVTIMRTKHTMFTTCGLLYKAGIINGQ